MPLLQLSLSPKPVTEEIRADERHQELSRQKAENLPSKKTGALNAPKKKKVVSPEMEEQQVRASTCMQELGVMAIEVLPNLPIPFDS